MTYKIKKTEYAEFYQPYFTALSVNNKGLIRTLQYSHEKSIELLSVVDVAKQNISMPQISGLSRKLFNI